MKCPVCEGDMFLPQYDEEGDINHFSECWLCNGKGRVIYLQLPFRIQVLLRLSQHEESEIIKADEKECKQSQNASK